MPRILIDTNVMVYLFDAHDQVRQDQAALVLRHPKKNESEAAYCTVSGRIF